MGCTQSKQRTDAPAAAPQAATATPVKSQIPVAAPVVVQESAPTPKAESPAPKAESPVEAEASEPECAVAPVATETTTETTTETIPETTTETIPETTTETIPETTTETTEAAANVTAASEPVQSAPSTPVIPALQMPSMLKKTKKATTPRKTTTPRKHQTPQKENVSTKRTSSKTPAKRGLGLANANTNTATAARKVSFESAPAPVANKAAVRNAKARKTLGKGASNVQMDMYAASVAAFERQLTYRGTLDKQLNTR